LAQVYNSYQHFESSHNAMIFIFSLLSVARGVYTVASVDESKATFMIMAGITSGSEMCLVAEGGATGVDGASVMLEPCLESLAAGDGRELWKFSSGGAIQSSEGNKCLKVSQDAVSLESCSHASAWEITAAGQLKTGSSSCLSQAGSFPGNEDVAAGSPVHATSTSDSTHHGARMAVDNDEASFWRSDPNSESDTQEFIVDFGGVRKLGSVEIAWEAPASSFAIQISKDGSSWTSVYSTDVNNLFATKAYLGYASAAKAKIVLKKAHSLYGSTNGKSGYAIRRLSFLAPRLSTIVSDCSSASESKDARDKYFLGYVGDFNPCPSKGLRAAVPSLEAAKTSLSAATTKLSDRVKNMGTCAGSSFLQSKPSGFTSFMQGDSETSSAVTGASEQVRRMNNIVGSSDTIDAARRVIVQARSSLA